MFALRLAITKHFPASPWKLDGKSAHRYVEQRERRDSPNFQELIALYCYVLRSTMHVISPERVVENNIAFAYWLIAAADCD